MNTPTHHALHHERFRGNYGLYFNVWDRLMGTNLPEYPARFEQAAGGSKALASDAVADGAGGQNRLRDAALK